MATGAERVAAYEVRHRGLGFVVTRVRVHREDVAAVQRYAGLLREARRKAMGVEIHKGAPSPERWNRSAPGAVTE